MKEKVINAAEALRRISKRHADCGANPDDPNGVWNEALYAAMKEVSEAPEADVHPNSHAHWVESSGDTGWVVCSHCGYAEDTAWADSGTPYCPNCGSKMDVQRKNPLTEDERRYLSNLVRPFASKVYCICRESGGCLNILREDDNGYCGTTEIPHCYPFAGLEPQKWYQGDELNKLRIEGVHGSEDD